MSYDTTGIGDIDLAQFDDDFSNASVEEKDFDEVPDGKYQVNVEKVELTKAQSSGNPMLKWTLKILGPKCAGRLLWRNSVITKATLSWLKTDLATCGLEIGGLSELSGMRSVIGIYSETEETLLKKKEQLTENREQSIETLEERGRTKQARDEFIDEALKSILATYGSHESELGDLFSVNPTSESWLREREAQLQELYGQGEYVQSEAAEHHANEKIIQNRVAAIHSCLETLRDCTEADTDTGRLESLEERLSKDCTLGDIPFAECQHFLSHLQGLRGEYIDFVRAMQVDRAGQKADERRKVEHSWIAEKLFLSTELGGLKKSMADLEIRDKQLEGEIVAVSSDMHRLRSYQVDKQRINSDLSNTMAKLGQRIEKLNRSIEEVDSSLGDERIRHKEVCEEFGRLFNRLIQYVLSDKYSGQVVFSPKERLDFRIRGLSGEAVQTLSCILADIAVMLWSVEGRGHHPRFLIHDSPREADLSGTAYASFLRRMHQISESLGGEDAPFQYIVTTTTSPPKDVFDAGCVRLTLSSIPPSEMLFGDNIELTLEGMDTHV